MTEDPFAAKTLADSVAWLLTSDPEALRGAFTVWNRLRDEQPVLRMGATVGVASYRYTKQALRDVEHFKIATFEESSERRARELSTQFGGDAMSAFFEVGRFEQHYMNRSGDGEKHGRLRRIAHRAFTPSRVAEMESSIATYTDELIDAAMGDEVADLAPFGYALPLMVICDMLGVPPEDRELVHGWSGRLGRNRGSTEAGPLVDARDAMREFRTYVEGILMRHRNDPESVSPLVAALVDAEQGERLTEVELTAMFVILLFAGHETTTNLIDHGIVALLSRPDQWQLLVEDPAGRNKNATEELLRFVTPVQWLSREARTPFEFAGEQIGAGESVMTFLAAANRDPSVFENPDVLDIERPNARDNLSFGFGMHFCLGASLARMEGAMAMRRLAERFPDMQLAVRPDELMYRGHAMLRGLDALPVVLGTDHGRRDDG